MSYPEPNCHAAGGQATSGQALRHLSLSLTIVAAAGLSWAGRRELFAAGGCPGVLGG